MLHIKKLAGYERWFVAQVPKFQAQVEERLRKIAELGHWGNVKSLGDGLAEIKFNNGYRIYFAHTAKNEITLLLGGNKNGQDKDIKKARKIFAG